MPRVRFTIRWPDGAELACESPSRAIERELVAGGRYPVGELVRRCVSGLAAASARVQARSGRPCAQAAAQLDAIAAAATAHAGAPGELAEVTVVRRLTTPPRFPAPRVLDGDYDAVVVGGGQAGLAVSDRLSARGVRHLVLERDRVGVAWHEQRWDSFCLVTPNWQCRLPGFPYPGSDPDGFMLRDEIVAYVEAYAEAIAPPLYEGVAVQRVVPRMRGDGSGSGGGAGVAGVGGFRIETSHGAIGADHVVLAVGGYHRPRVPGLAGPLAGELTQLHSSGYRNPTSLPDGAVLVVGSGQSGAQIAEDLLLAGREVHLSVGSAPRVARRYRGRDCVAWLEDIGHYDLPVQEHPQGLDARREPNHYVTGRDGGRDIDLRAHALRGLHLHGRLLGPDGDGDAAGVAAGGLLRFAGDLRANLDAADATAERIKDTIDRWIAGEGIDAPLERRYVPVWTPPPRADAAEALDLGAAGIRSVVWATGFVSDWSWVPAPAAFDAAGRPDHLRGVSGDPGLYFVGLPWLHTWGSGRFAGVARDAEHLAGVIAGRLGLARSPGLAA